MSCTTGPNGPALSERATRSIGDLLPSEAGLWVKSIRASGANGVGAIVTPAEGWNDLLQPCGESEKGTS